LHILIILNGEWFPSTVILEKDGEKSYNRLTHLYLWMDELIAS
jgi:hypothetical protein